MRRGFASSAHASLGARKLHDFSAVGVATAVVHLFHDLATLFAGAEEFKDCLKPTVPAQLDAVAFQQWLGRVEVFNADAAADEQLAGQVPCRRSTKLLLSYTAIWQTWTRARCKSFRT